MMKIKNDNIYSVLVFICSIFMYHVNVWNAFPIWDLFFLSVLGITFIAIIVNKKIRVTGYLKWVFALLAIAILVSVVQPFRNTSFTNIINMVKVIIPVLAIITFTDTFEKIKQVLLSLWSAGIVVSIELFMSFDANMIVDTTTMTQSRLGLGGIEHPNTTAYNLFISFVAGLFLLISSEQIKSKKKLFFLMCAGEILLVASCLLTGSRKVIIGILLAILLIVIRNSKNPVKLAVIILIGCVGIYVSYQFMLNNQVLYTLIGNRLESFLQGDDASSSGRNTLIVEAIKVGFNSVIGVGFGNYMNYNAMKVYAHNEFAEMFASIGFVGLLIYYVPVVNSLIKTFKKYFYKISPIYIAWFAMLFSVFIMELFQITYTLYSYHIMIALLLSYKIRTNEGWDSNKLVQEKNK